MPILGTIDSAKTGRLSNPAFYSIETQSVNGSQSITFNTISSDYKHLVIRYSCRNDRSTTSTGDSLALRFNSDTGANYNHWRTGADVTSGWTSNGSIDQTQMIIGDTVSNNAAGGIFTVGYIWIYNIKDTNMYKAVESIAGTGNSGGNSSFAGQYGGQWKSSNAITSVTVRGVGYNFVSSKFALYGIK